jgi:glutaredoxin
MTRVKLFIRSERLPVVRYEMPNTTGGGHWCSAANRVQSTVTSLAPQDRLAKEILTKSKIQFEVVDLSDRGRELVARIRGVKDTPTIIVEGSSRRKYEGVRAIHEYVSKGQN